MLYLSERSQGKDLFVSRYPFGDKSKVPKETVKTSVIREKKRMSKTLKGWILRKK